MENYIKAELLVLIPVLYALGLILKDSTLIKNKYIPLVLTGVSLALSNLYVLGTGGLSAANLFSGIVQGVLCVSCAVYADQLKKQFRK